MKEQFLLLKELASSAEETAQLRQFEGQFFSAAGNGSSSGRNSSISEKNNSTS
jgi:hypothetical protein